MASVLAASRSRSATLTLLLLVAWACEVPGVTSVEVEPVVAGAGAVSAGNGQTARVLTQVPVAPSITITDQRGRPMRGVRVTFTPSGNGAVGSATATTGEDGVASAGTWTLGCTVGAQTLTAAPQGLSAITFTATATAAVPSTISKVATTDGQSATVNTAVANPPSVNVRDAQGVAAGCVTIQFTAASGSGTVTGPTATTNASGLASATGWTLGTAAGIQSLTATIQGTATSVTFTATATAGPAASIAANSPTTVSAPVSSQVSPPPSVVVRDQFDNPVSGHTVAWSVQSGGGSITGSATLVTNASGISQVGGWTLGTSTTTGANTLRATASGTVSNNPVTFTATGTPPNTLAINAGNSQSAVVGTAVGTAPSVIVRTAASAPVAGVAVTFSVVSGGGSVNGATQVTNTAGIATVGSWTLGSSAGSNTMTATAVGTSPTFVTFGATATAPPATIAIASFNGGDNQTAIAGTSVTTPPRVVVRNANGFLMSGVTVTFAVASGGGSITGPVQTTNSFGEATVGSWTLGPALGTNTLTASVTGASGPLSVTFTATAAGVLAIRAGTNQSAMGGTAVPVPPSVIVTDGNDAPVRDVTITFAASSGGGTVSGATAVTDAAGVATVGGWTLGPATSFSVTNTMTASSTVTLPSFVTFSATATVAPATIAIQSGNNQTVRAGSAVPSLPTVKVRDGAGFSLSGVEVTFAVVSGGGSVTNAVRTTNGFGEANVGSWTLGPTAGPNSLTATVTGASGPLTVTFNATATPPPASIAATAPTSQSAVAGTAVTSPPSVVVRDASSNPVSGVSVTFAVTAGGGSVRAASFGSGVTSVAVTTDANGNAALNNWTLGNSPGANTVTATLAENGVSGNPVTFDATGTDACLASTPFSSSSFISGSLGVPDCVVDGFYRDNYRITAASQTLIAIDLFSSAFAPRLGLLSVNFDGAVSSSLDWNFYLAAGTYDFVVTSLFAGAAGSYSLDGGNFESSNGCLNWFATKGVTISSRFLSSTDCAYALSSSINSPPAGTRYAERIVMRLEGGQQLRVRLSASSFDPYLELREGSTATGTLAVADDDGGGGSDALLTFTPAASGIYSLWISSWEVGGIGAYTLSIDP